VKYRNKFEERTAEVLGDLCEYEPCKVPYTVHRNYTPDFRYITKEGTIYLECKGFFRVGDVQKYKAIRDSMAGEDELIFVLYNPKKKLRKGGNMTMEQWCVKEGLRNFTVETIKNALTN
jgi:hypothetical protein